MFYEPPPPPPVESDIHCPHTDAQTLAARRILSAPVLTEDNDICGFLDIRDILSSFLDGEPREASFWKTWVSAMALWGSSGICHACAEQQTTKMFTFVAQGIGPYTRVGYLAYPQPFP